MGGGDESGVNQKQYLFMRKIFFLLFVLISLQLNAMPPDTLTIPDRITISVVQEKVNSLQQQLNDSKNLLEAKKQEIEKVMDEKKDALDSRMKIYFWIFTALLAIALWLFNWLGKKEIRNLVGASASKKVDEELKNKFSKATVDTKLTEWGKPLIVSMVKEMSEDIDKLKIQIISKTESLDKDFEDAKKKMQSFNPSQPTTDEQKEATEKVEKGAIEQIKEGSNITSVIDFLFAKGVKAKERKEYEKSIQYFSDVLELENNNSNAYFFKAFAEGEMGMHKEAMKNYDKVILLDPGSVSAFYNRGLENHNLGKYEEAIKDYDEAILLNPSYVSAFYNRGLVKYKLGKYEEAIKDYDETILLDPSHVKAFYDRGLAKYYLGKYEEAIKDYDETILLDTNYVYAYNNRGLVNYMLGKNNEAIKDYDEAVSLDPNYSFAYYNRALTYKKIGNLEQALKDVEKSIELNPDYAPASALREEILQLNKK